MSAAESYRVIGLGELLWDLFPQGPQLGGAPTNVAYHASVLGNQGVVLTRVGSDDLGDKAIEILAHKGVGVHAVQRDPDRTTGTVRVDVQGEDVHFHIDVDVAWAYPDWTNAWEEELSGADAVCFGTLLCSQPQGRQVLERAAASVPPHALRLLDLNLRPPYDGDDAIEAAMACANAIKLSETEALRIASRLGKKSIEEVADTLIGSRGMRAVAVTFGAQGSALYTPDGSERHGGVAMAPGQAADPVGAGDGFTAALAHHLIRAHGPMQTNAAANRYGAFVASQPGAMPCVPEYVLTAVAK